MDNTEINKRIEELKYTIAEIRTELKQYDRQTGKNQVIIREIYNKIGKYDTPLAKLLKINKKATEILNGYNYIKKIEAQYDTIKSVQPPETQPDTHPTEIPTIQKLVPDDTQNKIIQIAYKPYNIDSQTNATNTGGKKPKRKTHKRKHYRRKHNKRNTVRRCYK